GGATEEDGCPGQVGWLAPALGGGAGEDVVVEDWDDLASTSGQVCVDPAGQDAVDLDVVGGPGRGQASSQLDDRAFCGRVNHCDVEAEDAGHRADRHNLAAAASFHLWMDGTAAGKDAGKVGIDDVVPLFQRIVLGRL